MARQKEALFARKPAAGTGTGETTPSRSSRTLRAETPQSEYASTIGGNETALFSPTSSRFPTPRRRIFRGIPRSPDEVAWGGGGWDSDEGSDGMAEATPTSKRKRGRGDDEGAGSGANNARGRHETLEVEDFDADEVMQLVEIADRDQQLQLSQQSQRSQFSDPTTPSGKGMRANFAGLPTPESRNRQLVASEPGPKRFKTAQGAPALTPTPARTRNALSQSQESCEDDAEITVAVMGLLRGETIMMPVRRAIRDTLNLHALKARGVERGRDLLREALKARDQKIAELQSRVVKLENERLAKRERLKQATSDLQALFQDGADD